MIQDPNSEQKEETPDASLPPDDRVGYAVVGLGRPSLNQILPALSHCKYSKPTALVWYAPNLRADPGSGLGRIGEADIASFLKTGHGGGMVAFGSMVQTVGDSLQYLDDADLRAVAAYLKSLPATGAADGAWSAASGPAPAFKTRAPDKPPAMGEAAYASFCTECHRPRGEGVPNPALAGNPSVLSEDTTSLIRLLVEGGNSPATKHGPPRQAMPPSRDS
jgi:mono/diheme cytochrome c family protein